MNPRSGENPPLISSSRSQIWREVRSEEGHSRECPVSSLIRSGCAISSASSPPCGGIRWLVVEVVKSVNLPSSLVCNLHNYSCLDMRSDGAITTAPALVAREGKQTRSNSPPRFIDKASQHTACCCIAQSFRMRLRTHQGSLLRRRA